MMYFFLLKKTTTAKNLFGNNKLVDFSKNLSKKTTKKQSKFDPPKKNHSYANKNEKKEVETKTTTNEKK